VPSYTEYQQPYGEIGQRLSSLADTPGFRHTDLEDREILQQLKGWFDAKVAQSHRVGAISCLSRVSDARISKFEKQHLFSLRTLIVNPAFRFMGLITMCWEPVERDFELVCEATFMSEVESLSSLGLEVLCELPWL
jgi:hypothetical protein